MGSPVSPFVGGYDVVVAKLDANGTLLWNTSWAVLGMTSAMA